MKFSFEGAKKKVEQVVRKATMVAGIGGAVAGGIALNPSESSAQKIKTEESKTLVLPDTPENRKREKQYKDSLDVFNLSQKVVKNPGNYPPSTKEKNDSLREASRAMPRYEFDDDQYKKDKKENKVKEFKDYIYTLPSVKKDASIQEYEATMRESDAYNRNYPVKDDTPDKKVVLKDGTIRSYETYKGEIVDKGMYSDFDPKTGTYRNYIDGKLNHIYVPNERPIKTEYFAKDNIEEGGSISLSSKNTGWYKEGEKPVFKNTSAEKYTNYFAPVSEHHIYKKPTQPIKIDKNLKVETGPIENIKPVVENKFFPLKQSPQKVEQQAFSKTNEHIVDHSQFPNIKIVYIREKDGKLTPAFYQNTKGERVSANDSAKITKEFQYPDTTNH